MTDEQYEHNPEEHHEEPTHEPEPEEVHDPLAELPGYVAPTGIRVS